MHTHKWDLLFENSEKNNRGGKMNADSFIYCDTIQHKTADTNIIVLSRKYTRIFSNTATCWYAYVFVVSLVYDVFHVFTSAWRPTDCIRRPAEEQGFLFFFIITYAHAVHFGYFKLIQWLDSCVCDH